MPPFKDLTGKTFNKMKVISLHGKRGTAYIWECKCLECGKIKYLNSGLLNFQNSCYCTNVSHGMSKRREYSIWSGMISRCNKGRYNKNGIAVCKRWKNSFENFIKDMGPSPKGFSIDRINNNLGYSPSNCRWASSLAQSNNRSVTIFVRYGGETIPLSTVGKNHSVPRSVLHKAYMRGENVEKFAKNYKKRKRVDVIVNGKIMPITEASKVMGITVGNAYKMIKRGKLHIYEHSAS